MQAETGKNNRHIAWNGVCLDIPCAWDARVSGQRQLIFEKDFEPQLQIRWEKVGKNTPKALRRRLHKFAAQMGPLVEEDNFPLELQPIKDTFDLVVCFQKESGKIAGGIFLCPDGHTLLLFQLLAHDPTLLKEMNSCLTTLSCPSHSGSLWCIQDFSLSHSCLLHSQGLHLRGRTDPLIVYQLRSLPANLQAGASRQTP